MMRKFVFVVVAIALLAGLQLGAPLALDNYLIRIVSLCGINVMLAVALNLVNGTTGQFSIGHAGFMAVGAYAGAITTHVVDHRIHAMLPAAAADGTTLIVACIVAMIVAGFAGILVGVPSLRLRGDYLAIVTLGFGEIIRISIESTERLGGSQGYPLGSESIPPYAKLGWVWAGAVVCAALAWNLTYSTHGRALAAIREDEIAAEAVGVPTTRYKVLAFAISAMMTGLAGALYAHDATGGQHIDPGGFKLDKSVDMLVMIIFGGLGSVTGAVIGGVFVGVSLEFLREIPNLMRGILPVAGVTYLRQNAGNIRLIVYALLLVLMMLLRPQGILGTREFRLSALRSMIPGLRKKPGSDRSTPGSNGEGRA